MNTAGVTIACLVCFSPLLASATDRSAAPKAKSAACSTNKIVAAAHAVMVRGAEARRRFEDRAATLACTGAGRFVQVAGGASLFAGSLWSLVRSGGNWMACSGGMALGANMFINGTNHWSKREMKRGWGRTVKSTALAVLSAGLFGSLLETPGPMHEANQLKLWREAMGTAFSAVGAGWHTYFNLEPDRHEL